MDQNIYKKAILENDYVIKTNLEGNITFVNENFCKTSGFCEHELLGSKYNKIIKLSQNNQKINKNMLKNIFLGKNWQGVIENETKTGDFLYLDTNICPVRDEKENIIEILAFGNNVTEHIKLINYDKMTNLKNRESLRNQIQKNKNYITVIANLDSFSEINEFYGGYTGDKVIQECAKRLTNVFSKNCVYRLQGDEFAVLIPLPYRFDREFQIDSAKNKLKSLFE